jgi:transcriptional regulator with XRE-family HTH domain
METLGQRVRRLRGERKLTQEQLVANIPGMKASALSQLEGGQSKTVKPENLLGLAKALGLTMEELVTGKLAGGHKPQSATIHAPMVSDSRTERMLAVWDQLPWEIQDDYIGMMEAAAEEYAKLRLKVGAGRAVSDERVRSVLPKAPASVPVKKK